LIRVKKSNTDEENKLIEVLYKEFDNGFLDDVYKIGTIVYHNNIKALHFICTQKKKYHRDFFDKHLIGNIEGKSGFMLSGLVKIFGVDYCFMSSSLLWNSERRRKTVSWKYIK
jgi:hypothetical protein